jgi:hypothetical protein
MVAPFVPHLVGALRPKLIPWKIQVLARLGGGHTWSGRLLKKIDPSVININVKMISLIINLPNYFCG